MKTARFLLVRISFIALSLGLSGCFVQSPGQPEELPFRWLDYRWALLELSAGSHSLGTYRPQDPIESAAGEASQLVGILSHDLGTEHPLARFRDVLGPDIEGFKKRMCSDPLVPYFDMEGYGAAVILISAKSVISKLLEEGGFAEGSDAHAALLDLEQVNRVLASGLYPTLEEALGSGKSFVFQPGDLSASAVAALIADVVDALNSASPPGAAPFDGGDGGRSIRAYLWFESLINDGILKVKNRAVKPALLKEFCGYLDSFLTPEALAQDGVFGGWNNLALQIRLKDVADTLSALATITEVRYGLNASVLPELKI